MNLKSLNSNKLFLAVFSVLFVFSIVPTALAQNKVEQGNPTELKVITNGQENTTKVTAIISAKNNNNDRVLGDVKVTFDKSTTVTLQDPPSIEGYKLANLSSGKHEVVAERSGYAIYDNIVNVPADKQFFNLEIKLKPLETTTKVDDSYFRRTYGSNYLGYPTNYSLYSNTTVTNPWNSYQGIYNPYGYNPQTGQYYNSAYNNSNSSIFTDSISQSRSISLKGQTNYAVTRSSQNGDYLFYNKTNNKEYRHMFFIDRADGQGGIVFFSADTENGKSLAQVGSSAGSWFVSTYVKDQYQNAIFPTGIFVRTTTSPQNYGVDLYNQLNSTQNGQGGSQLQNTATDNSCIEKNNINFCFTEDATRQAALSGAMNARIEGIANRIIDNESIMQDKKGNPDFIIMSDPGNSIWSQAGSTTKAFACFMSSASLQSQETCANVVNEAFSQEEINSLNGKNIALKFMVVKSDTNLENRENRIYVDHEWAHIYDYVSDQASSTSIIYAGRQTQPSVSTNSKFAFASFYNKTSVAAQNRFNELKNAAKFNIQETLKPYPYCVYGALTDYLATDPEQITGNEISSYNTNSTFVVDRVQELFAYGYSLVRDQKIDAFNQLFSKFGIDPKCPTQLSELQTQYLKLFNYR